MKKLVLITFCILGYLVSYAQHGGVSKYSGTLDTSKVMFEFKTWNSVVSSGEFYYKSKKNVKYEFDGLKSMQESSDTALTKLKFDVTLNNQSKGYVEFPGYHDTGCNLDKKIKGKWYVDNKVYSIVLTLLKEEFF